MTLNGINVYVNPDTFADFVQAEVRVADVAASGSGSLLTSGNTCVYFNGPATTTLVELVCDAPMLGRYITLQRCQWGNVQPFRIEEIAAFTGGIYLY